MIGESVTTGGLGNDNRPHQRGEQPCCSARRSVEGALEPRRKLFNLLANSFGKSLAYRGASACTLAAERRNNATAPRPLDVAIGKIAVDKALQPFGWTKLFET